jgi:hypothetical protein
MRPYLKRTHHKKKSWWSAEGVGLEFKSQYCKNKNKQTKKRWCQAWWCRLAILALGRLSRKITSLRLVWDIS